MEGRNFVTFKQRLMNELYTNGIKLNHKFIMWKKGEDKYWRIRANEEAYRQAQVWETTYVINEYLIRSSDEIFKFSFLSCSCKWKEDGIVNFLVFAFHASFIVKHSLRVLFFSRFLNMNVRCFMHLCICLKGKVREDLGSNPFDEKIFSVC